MSGLPLNQVLGNAQPNSWQQLLWCYSQWSGTERESPTSMQIPSSSVNNEMHRQADRATSGLKILRNSLHKTYSLWGKARHYSLSPPNYVLRNAWNLIHTATIIMYDMVNNERESPTYIQMPRSSENNKMHWQADRATSGLSSLRNSLHEFGFLE